MSARSERLLRSLRLPEAETSYLREFDRAARGVSGTTRRRVVRSAAEILAERPGSLSLEALEEELGAPSDLFEQFRRDEGISRHAGPWRRWWDLAPIVRLVQVAAVAVLVIGCVWFRNYYIAVPDFSIPCGGMVASESEIRQASGHQEFIAVARHHERIGFQLCPFPTTPGATLTGISFPGAAPTPLQPVGWEVSLRQDSLSIEGDASNDAEISFDLVNASGWKNAVVWFEVEACLPLGGFSFDHVLIDYRYRSRERSIEVPLLYTYTVQFPFDRCSERSRETHQSESDAFEEVARRAGLDAAMLWRRVGPLGLYPEDVSRNLCRYLRGVRPATRQGVPVYAEFESLSDRALFQLDDHALAAILIDGAVLGICAEFADQRDELVAMIDA